MRKILSHDVFSYFVEILLSCCLLSYDYFLLNVHFEGVDKLLYSNSFIAGVVVAGDKLSPVLLLPVFIGGVIVIGN
jgi:hypothetical protein